VTAMVAATVNSIGWITGYQALSRSRGWDSLQVRFSAIEGRIMLASASGTIALMLLTSALAVILNGLGIKITDIRPTVIMPRDPGQLPLAIISIVIHPKSHQPAIAPFSDPKPRHQHRRGR
jgi:hypothetical protein